MLLPLSTTKMGNMSWTGPNVPQRHPREQKRKADTVKRISCPTRAVRYSKLMKAYSSGAGKESRKAVYMVFIDLSFHMWKLQHDELTTIDVLLPECE